MAAPTDRSTAGLLVCLVDPVSNRHASVARCVGASCKALDQVGDPPPKERSTAYPGRTPRFAYVAKQREGSIERPTSPHELSPPMKTPVMDRSNEEGGSDG